jgi:hypothetical protein
MDCPRDRLTMLLVQWQAGLITKEYMFDEWFLVIAQELEQQRINESRRS